MSTSPDDNVAPATPPWSQAVQLVVLVGLGIYFFVVFRMSLTALPTWALPGMWQMFTIRDPNAAMVVAEARYDDDWEPIDLPALFPSRWGSGYRYSRSSFKKSKRRMSVLAASTCLRLERTPKQVRFIEHRWKKKLGTLERRDPTQRLLLTHSCRKKVTLPNGTVLPDDVETRR